MDNNYDMRNPDFAMQVLKRSKSNLKKNSLDSILPLTGNDIEEVALLSRIYFPGSKEISLNELKKTITELYFTEGILNSNPSSLVSREKDGSINGFLGVTSNPYHYKGKIIKVANCHHLMATEQARKKLVPMKILQKFLSGPQDLSFADNSVESTRLLWKRLGGESAIGECLYYKIPLKPVSFGLRPFLKNINIPIRKTAALLAKATDSVGEKIRLPMFYRSKPDVELTPLYSQLLLETLIKIRDKYSLFPRYSRSKIEHLFNLLSSEKRYGTLYKFAIVDEKDGVVGWFIYYSLKGGVCEVIQAVCVPGKETVLFDALTWHAYRQGGIELCGRLMANQLQSPFALKAVCMPARMWTLFHCTDSDLMLDIQTGKAFFTRLEGDLWLI